jgi:hypothetical protein
MKDTDFLTELKVVLNAQRGIVSKIDSSIEGLGVRIESAERQAREIDELSGLLDEIEKGADILSSSDLGGWEEEDARLQAIYDERRGRFEANMATLEYHNWQQFVRDSQIYCLSKGIEPLLPWQAILSDEDLAQLKAESYEAQYWWDKWDYLVVGAAGVLAFLTDCFLVAIPKTMTSGVYKGQSGSIVTEKLRTLNLPPSVQGWLKNAPKVPYDHTGGGDHRIDSFGHDPILGFIFGTLDIFRGGATTIKGGDVAFKAGLADPTRNPISAVVTQFLHMLSDVTTSKGLPVPFGSILRALKVGSFPGPSGKSHTLSELILWMYHNGYDLRHFVTMGITPATIEIVLRAYLMIRHYSVHGETKFFLADNPKYRSMLLSAHAIACAGNAGKYALGSYNPLAINYAEWLALLRYLMPSLKYWIFDRSRLKIEHLQRINEKGWQELCQSSDALLTKVYKDTSRIFPLGGGLGSGLES